MKYGLDFIAIIIFMLIVAIIVHESGILDEFDYLIKKIILFSIFIGGIYPMEYILTAEIDKKGKSNNNDNSYSESKENDSFNLTADNQKIIPSKDELRYAKILGLSGKVRVDDIEKAYKKKLKEYHPDKVNSMGDDLKKLAEQKTKQIIDAYNYFMEKYNK